MMRKNNTTYIILGIVGFILFIAIISSISTSKPRSFDWFPTYLSHDHQPYGAFVYFNELPNFFPNKKVKRLSSSDLTNYTEYTTGSYDYEEYEYDEYETSEYDEPEENDEYDYDGTYDTDSDSEDTYTSFDETEQIYDESEESDLTDLVEDSLYWNNEDIDEDPLEVDLYQVEKQADFNVIYLNDELYEDDYAVEALLRHVSSGNDALLCVLSMQANLENFLHVHIQSETNVSDKSDYYSIRFKNGGQIQHKPFSEASYISHYPKDCEILATASNNKVLGIQIKLGEGRLTIFTLPILFTNYYVLKQDNHISENLTLLLPEKDTYWANRLATVRSDRSILQFIHQHESLTWAFYTLLFSLLIFFAFQVRRRQRMIPLIEPPKNTSVQFLETLSQLYLSKSNYKDILHRKMNYFLMRVRNSYNIDTSQINEEFMKRLASKSNVKLAVIQLMFRRYTTFTNKPFVTADELKQVNNLFQQFKQTKNGR